MFRCPSGVGSGVPELGETLTASDLPAADPSAPAAAAPPLGDDPLHKQWLLTDGLGGYATGNALDLPRRRYDCWLTTLAADGHRVRLVAGADERVIDRDGEHELSAVHWRSMTAPSVPAAVRLFRPEPVPTWTWRCDLTVLERSVAMRRGQPAVLVRWRNVGARRLRLRIRPLLCGEDADALLRERAVDLSVHSESSAHRFGLATAVAPLWLSIDGPASFRPDPCWYRDYWYALDHARGYDAVSDRLSPGVLEAELEPDQAVVVAFGVGAPVRAPAAEFAVAVQEHKDRRAAADRATTGLEQRLCRGVDDFFYRAPGGRLGVLAGYPWFGEWGRDVFVALPGLSLAAGAPERCGEVLRSALPFLRRGLLPNIYGLSPADSHYGSADAALWYALCVQRWQAHGADVAAVRTEFGPALRQIADAYRQGTDLGLRTDEQGLLFAGGQEHNATWMDARTPAGPVTPREGQPVEINALWCALLLHLGELFGGDDAVRAKAVAAAFVRRFWRRDAGCLFDRWHAGRGDPSIRPNMIVAAALPRSPLDRQQRQSIVAVVTAELVTPRGLRTLAAGDPAYRSRYEGGPEQRDGAYHQGTVWPWLAGFYVEAALAAAAPAEREAVRIRLLAWLQGFVPEIDRAGGSHLAEVFDGDAPQRPGGTFAQAWNTGELLRAVRLCTEPTAGERT